MVSIEVLIQRYQLKVDWQMRLLWYMCGGKKKKNASKAESKELSYWKLEEQWNILQRLS